MTKVKLCGLTRHEDVRVAVLLGADYLGLNFVPGSPRQVTPLRATELAAAARDEAASVGVPAPRLVGVFAGSGASDIAAIAEAVGLDVVQLHGGERIEVVQRLSLPCICAWRSAGAGDRPDVQAHPAWAHLLDAHVPGMLGGSGRLCNWNLAAELARACRLFLAGGLNPGNVAKAVACVRPFAVDVASGIEGRPGVKDGRLMEQFIREVRKSDRDG